MTTKTFSFARGKSSNRVYAQAPNGAVYLYKNSALTDKGVDVVIHRFSTMQQRLADRFSLFPSHWEQVKAAPRKARRAKVAA